MSALCLAGCAAAPVAPAPLPRIPDAEGIALAGSPLRIDFGRSQAGVIAAVTRLQGRGPAGSASCADGATAVGWPDGLSLHFRDGAFLGWAEADGSAAGIPCPR